MKNLHIVGTITITNNNNLDPYNRFGMSVLTWEEEEKNLLLSIIHKQGENSVVAVNTYGDNGVYTKFFVKASVFLRAPERKHTNNHNSVFFTRKITKDDIVEL